MTLIRRAMMMLDRGVSVEQAERMLRRHRPPPPPLTAAERMRRSKQEWAEAHGLDVTHGLAEERRLWQRMGWDLAEPDE